ncbi:nitrate reductase molybdenum cofactor assembly chaperone [Yersinia enterocolitica]|jgi:nitrate reductase delta subunit|uniref:nitrate reductase molybdenum cofactor assembly chaperone n=1 Tax=Yersinia TaxID=629 RepID=UPI0005E3E05F|nr:MULTISPECIES: nitrate reductase molybdenum cofactor assembly chaperone [Yersinia]HEC1651328.1 nitrate reductase molybdenum cofactor assembly chaperone [Yersinia enterocolitica]ATM86741.1 nitrate reductase molybdenum cofactor assembly chaperone [Yersinia frederiksenii]MCB5318102.1 nitrate reductase molybdenum cofactor assembly chaperone [Yersinia massiliensis]CFR16306.1 Redox enzyme maturation protein NarJ [Yersinia frederiksenii]CNK65374.1 Redox enzyme maturation protein NarJ [Yersinia fred
MMSLRIISRLLEYPDADLWQHSHELIEALTQADELTAEQRKTLTEFVSTLCRRELLDCQAAYCGLFDRGRATSLLLFEHVHGESRDRGQAMVDLMAQYQRAGLILDCKELPDFLPLYLEYLVSQSVAEATLGLQDIAPILALLGARLHQRDSEYAQLFDLLLALSGSDIRSENLDEKVAGETRDDTPKALDAVWEEEQVKFLGSEGCSSAQHGSRQKHVSDAVLPQYLNIQSASEAKKVVQSNAAADVKGVRL